jgi:hypothetical protein
MPSKYPVAPFDLSRIQTYALKERTSKVDVAGFGRPHIKGSSVGSFLGNLPDILAARALRDLVEAMARANSAGKPILWGLGGHVIKTGLNPILIDLMKRGFVAGIALNGSGIIHDFEIAWAGATSEDVAAQLDEGTFGMAEEPGRDINRAIREGVDDGLGIGESLGRYLDRAQAPYDGFSLLVQAYRHEIPVTVHVTIGADVIHNHPGCSPAALGEGSHRDFRLFAGLVAGLDGGGVYLNCGSAVTLPEVFLKCVTLVRNSGASLKGFTTANLDFIQHYRPLENIVKRPVLKGGQGIALTGHHEIMIPLLAAALIELAP